ncbi:MAG: 6-phosphofructokinase [Ostreibacterium sp.]
MRIGVVTGGGDCPGLNAVIRAFTRSAIINYGWEIVGIPDAFIGLLKDEPEIINLNYNTIRGILSEGGTILGTSNRADPFKFPVTQIDGSTINEDCSQLLLQRLTDFHIDVLLMIGGDGTMRIAKRLTDLGLNIVGVPKTIDNDLYATDITFGHDSACNVAMEAIDRLYTTAYSHHRIMICEVMGRDAGWLALQSGISGGADVILIPELPYNIDKIIEHLNKRRLSGQKSSIIVVAEGAKPQGGEIVTQGQGQYAPRYGGISVQLEAEINQRTKQEVRSVVLGHLQRGGSPTHFDRVLASRYGEYATQLIERGQFGHITALQNGEIVPVNLEQATQKIKQIDPESSQLVQTAKRMDVSFGI